VFVILRRETERYGGRSICCRFCVCFFVRRMGRSRSYSPPVRRERSRSPASLRGRRMDDEEGMRGDGSGSSRKYGRDRESGRRCSSPPTSLLVRNISRASRPDDLRIPFERYGPVKDVYLPKDYHSG
jgi:FUS-interacting serine-arginine-rich protein 1